MKSIHLYDIGVVFKAKVVDEDNNTLNISTLQSGSLTFKRPDDTKFNVSGHLYTDGSDGIIAYTSASNDINMAGLWSLQGQVLFSGQMYYTDISDFRVERNL